MSVRSAKVNVGDLTFQVFNRPLHPELFRVHRRAEVERPAYRAEVRIHDVGHVVTFCHLGRVLCEVVAPRETPLPQRKRMLNLKLRGQRSETLHPEGGLTYQMNFQVEQLDPEVFQQLHEELLADGQRAAAAHHFGSPNRLWPAPLSTLHLEPTPRTLLVQSSHTFPESCAIVKVLTLFEV